MGHRSGWIAAVVLVLAFAFGAVAGNRAPARVVSTAPALTEMVWAAGAVDRLVAVSDYCRFPPGVARLPKVGGLMNLNYELIARLKPDLVLLMQPSTEIAQRLDRMGVPYATFANETLDEIRSSIATMCKLFGREDRCRSFLNGWDEKLRAIRDRYADAGVGPRTMVVVGREAGRLSGLYVAGAGSFYDEILGLLRCPNAFGRSHSKYFQPSLEAVATAAPDVIVEIWAGRKLSDGQKARLKGDWEKLRMIPAVRNGRIYILTEDYAGVPSARAVETIELLERVLRLDER